VVSPVPNNEMPCTSPIPTSNVEEVLQPSTISFDEEVVFGIDLNNTSGSSSPVEEGVEAEDGATFIRFDER